MRVVDHVRRVPSTTRCARSVSRGVPSEAVDATALQDGVSELVRTQRRRKRRPGKSCSRFSGSPCD